jgi:hypothetical protein
MNGLVGFLNDPITVIAGLDSQSPKEWVFDSSGNLTLPAGGNVLDHTGTNIIDLYPLPTATTNILGGVKVDGTTITITDGVISANHIIDIKGSVFANDSSLIIDGNNGNIHGNQITAAAFKGTLVADDSTVIVDGITGKIPGYISIADLKTIVADSLDFADFQTKVAAL